MLPENVRERVVKEQNELRDKITKLALFIYTVDKKQAGLLKAQLHVMEEYDEILTDALDLSIIKRLKIKSNITKQQNKNLITHLLNINKNSSG